MSRRHAVAALALLLACAPGSLLALATDREQPIHIEADSVEIDDVRGFSIYRGHVVYTQGSIRMEADTVHVFHTPERRVSRVEAHGAPVRFRQRIEGHDEDMKAEALRIEYIAEPERMILEREAHIWRLNAEFSGEYINYDPVRDVVRATRGEQDAGRVQIVIQPQQPANGEPDAPRPDAPAPDDSRSGGAD